MLLQDKRALMGSVVWLASFQEFKPFHQLLHNVATGGGGRGEFLQGEKRHAHGIPLPYFSGRESERFRLFSQ